MKINDIPKLATKEYVDAQAGGGGYNVYEIAKNKSGSSESLSGTVVAVKFALSNVPTAASELLFIGNGEWYLRNVQSNLAVASYSYGKNYGIVGPMSSATAVSGYELDRTYVNSQIYVPNRESGTKVTDDITGKFTICKHFTNSTEIQTILDYLKNNGFGVGITHAFTVNSGFSPTLVGFDYLNCYMLYK